MICVLGIHLRLGPLVIRRVICTLFVWIDVVVRRWSILGVVVGDAISFQMSTAFPNTEALAEPGSAQL